MISQVVAYLGVAVASAWTLRTPVVGLAAYYVIALARPHDMYWWWGETHLSLPLAIVLSGVGLFRWFQGTNGRFQGGAVGALVLVFFLLKVVSAAFAADQTAAWDHIVKVFKCVLFYYVTVSLVDTRPRFRAMSLVLAASLGWLGLWGNWQWYVEGVGGGAQGELTGPGWQAGRTLSDRNVFGYMLALGVPICIFVFMAELRPWIRWPVLGCVPFLANGVMLTFGRAAFLVMMTGSAWSLVRLRRASLVVIFAIAGALMMYRLAGPEVVARVLTIGPYMEDKSAVGRLEAWKAGLAMMREHPMLGVGPGNFGRYSRAYNPDVSPGLVAHNEFIGTGAETGILSALVFLVIIGLIFRDLAWVRRTSWPVADTRWAYYYAAMLESTVLSYLVAAMFVSLPFFELFYFLVALTVCLRGVVEDSAGQTAPAPEGVPDRSGREWWRRLGPGASTPS